MSGIILEYELRSGHREMKEIDLLFLTPETDVEVLVNQVPSTPTPTWKYLPWRRSGKAWIIVDPFFSFL
jgi:hypothetical protein